MKRRAFLSGFAGFAVLLAAAPAHADTPVDQVIRQLRKQGFNGITTEWTWLGRARIQGKRGKQSREIILDPNTGEILRDIWFDDDGKVMSRLASGDGDDNDGSHGGHGSGDDDSDDDDDNDDDHSGHGGGDDDGDDGDSDD